MGKPLRREKFRQPRRMRNGLGILHVYFRAIPYLYLLLFCMAFPFLIAMGISGGNLSIAAFVALLFLGVLFYFTRRRKFWTIFRDVFSRRTKVMGRVSRISSKTTDGMYTTTEHFITVRGEAFPVFGKICDWLFKGDEVVVYYWPHSRTVAWVEKVDVAGVREIVGDVDDRLMREIANVLHAEGTGAEPLSGEQYAQLPFFNWDVQKYLHQAAVSLRGQEVDILHVVTLRSKATPTGVDYRAKALMECPKHLLEGRGRKDEPISISFKVQKKRRVGQGGSSVFEWQSDRGTKLERRIAEAFNLDTSLTNALTSSGHVNVNAWLEEVDYIAINTSKPYTQVQEVDEFLNSANLIAKRLKDFR